MFLWFAEFKSILFHDVTAMEKNTGLCISKILKIVVLHKSQDSKRQLIDN